MCPRWYEHQCKDIQLSFNFTTLSKILKKATLGQSNKTMFSASWFLIASVLLSFVGAEENVFDQTYCRTGRKGRAGKEGPYGEPGLKGNAGDIGPLGLTGPLATDMKLDMYVSEQQVVKQLRYLYFSSLNEQSSEFQLMADAFGSYVVFLKPGLFMVSFIVQAFISNESSVVIDVELDETVVPFSRYSSDVVGKQLIGQTILNVLTAGSILKIRSNSADDLVTIYTSGINASVNIVRYGEPVVNKVPIS